MNITPFNSVEHYKTLSEWWTHFGFTPIPPEILPTTGLVVSGDSGPICAGFLYNTDSRLGFIEWLISDPNSDKQERDGALDMLVSALLKKADGLGLATVFSTSDRPALIKRYEKHGAVTGDPNVSILIWRINASTK